ncbi:sigma factor-like helix-turn-helix DNA-binding protein [Cohnella yongneupensis]|uniref:Sigma factor-like helix-turn-helix DNA-binding protein n=1 Tax=Cohnella yongneupensis TaxID=425006 RepID=A0ABW0R773_9BACL
MVAITWVKALIKDYHKSRSIMIKYRDSLDPDAEWQEVRLVNETIAGMNYAIEWMRSGRQPNTSRGIDIRDAYKRSILMDMDLLPSTPPEQEQEQRITTEQKQAAVKVLMKLSPRELECYLLHKSNGLSLADIGKELKLSKRVVQQYVDRAKAKVAQAI